MADLAQVPAARNGRRAVLSHDVSLRQRTD
jgi:hypothetical protein